MIVQPEPKPKRWIMKSLSDAARHQEAIETLTHQLGVSPFLAGLLVQRGCYSYDDARLFFRPEISHLHDPFRMKDMDKAVLRLQMALIRGEKILVYGDYDVDGTTSVALFYGFLKSIYPNVDYYIPDRYAEGYGISKMGVEWAADHDFTLIISLDCGIKSVERVAEASALGVDFIICDHHRPGAELPPAVAVLDPKRDDCEYPYKELSGCGVGFKLLQAFCQLKDIPMAQLYPYLDLVAVSIASDIVPITGENRVLAYWGLKQLNTSPRAGLKALIKVAGLHKELDIMNVVFGLGPRINAAGRIKHAKEAVRLLLAETDAEADDFALAINTHNQNRQTFDKSITEQALDMIRQNEAGTTAKTTVLFDPGWHKGVIGIVASRCIEHFHRPTIILTESHNKAAGSARSVPGFDVYEAIEACADLLEQFGGHTFAAGLTLKIENIPAFQQRFEEVVSRSIADDYLTPCIEVDMSLDFRAIDRKFYNILRQMAPFGPQNMQPVFVTDDVYLVGPPVIMKEKHLKLCLRHGEVELGKWAPTFTAVGFNMAHWAEQLPKNEPFSVCYHLEENSFNGDTSIQLYLKDIKTVS
ncbi:MAG: single-stranded-DNA-specific exonuclease RecJ [Bacteroidetes bacterium]|nr:single-stranded-DNA-specific exonuclease RecJ [Fibrella sp.]